MEEAEILVIKRSEIKRWQIIDKVIRREINQTTAAEVLGITGRQVRRLMQRVRRQGPQGIIHGLRGRVSNRKLADRVKKQVLMIYKRKYEGFGPTLACEKLREQEGYKISKETIRQWLVAEGIWQQRKSRQRRHLKWRERKAHCGEMVQVDGSHHAWLEDRGPRLVLMGWIDDATNRVFGHFYEYEGTVPALDSLKRYIEKHGIPSSVYVDRHTTYKAWAKENWEEEGQKTNFEKACLALGIHVIHAYSPQAKGRVERLFKTLQDRLVKELRLAEVKTLEEANKVLGRFLAAHNQRFCVMARESGDMHRAWPEELSAEEIFAVHTDHRLRNDNTVVHKGQWYQVLSKTRAHKVTLREGIDGRRAILASGKKLEYRVIPGPLAKSPKLPKPQTSHRVHPAASHPWRRAWV